MLTVLAAVPAFAACALGTAELPADDNDPDHDGATGTEPDDTGSEPQDTATTPQDSGTTPQDTGTTPTDTGTTPKDSGTTPADTGTTTCTGTLVSTVAAFAVGTFKKVGNAYVGRDSAGFWAIRSICTHDNASTIGTPTASGGSTCPRHGAKFDVNGKVTKGPAVNALANYQVTICNGNVYVNTSKTVTMGTRVSA